MANVYLEGTYSEIYPAVSLDEAGLLRLVRQFSTPGGIPSHVSVPTPGSIHEGGELGYALVHAFGAVFDNPDLLAACVVGDGEAETGPLEGSWKGMSFLNPRRDGAVLPILHLNGYKIAAPRCSAALASEDVRGLLGAHGYEVHVVGGDDPPRRARGVRAHARRCYERIREIQSAARQRRERGSRPRGRRSCCAPRKDGPARRSSTGSRWRAPSAPIRCPLADVRDNPAHLAQLEEWMRCYRPEELFDGAGRPVERCAWRRTATCGWDRRRTPTAAGCSGRCELRDFTRVRDDRRPRRDRRASRPAGSAS